MAAAREAYDELYIYTMGRGRTTFILQHVVDAYAAQTADAHTKPIAITFALVGLYLHVEKGFTGRQVQQVHTQLGRQQRSWPSISLPPDRGNMSAADVMTASVGAERDHAIDAWCQSVWAAYHESRTTVVELLRDCGMTQESR
jgi:hypothetical protein